MKLRCLRRYANASYGLSYQPGDELEATPEMWIFLQADSPGTFEIFKEVVEPPVDKAVKSPPRSKAVRRTRSKKT